MKTAVCMPPPSCLGPPPVSIGGMCGALGDTCWYSGGLTCVCGADFTWGCDQESAPCPLVPGNVGATCSSNEDCTYAACGSPHHTVMTCQDGHWAERTDTVCALSP